MTNSILEYVEEQSKVFTDAVSEESDRALGIIAVCWLDYLLERLLRAYYVKDPQVRLLFKDDHILQTFSAKVNIAYFSGLISKFIYHDLKLVGAIRNRFAHEVIAKLGFNDESITSRINNCMLRPKTLNSLGNNRIEFILIVTQIGGLLVFLERMVFTGKLPKLMDILKLDEKPFEEMALTKSELVNILAKYKDMPKGG